MKLKAQLAGLDHEFSLDFDENGEKFLPKLTAGSMTWKFASLLAGSICCW